jgi:16S rRNA (adenine1518-N6/adenine1519-N6)-dimethyltransferase
MLAEARATRHGRRSRRLGQNFLTDPNLLDAIVRDANLSSDDVVLEVGGGEGALSERLAPAVAHVHVIELDERLRVGLEELARAHENVSLTWGDAMRLDLAALAPEPTALVSNLPYSIATPLLLRTIDELPSLDRWTAMVQREVAERLRAAHGSRTYGAPSALVQLACTVEILRFVDPEVFSPRPRVDSALVGLRRHGPAPPPRTKWLISAAFAHRRKSLPRSVELAAEAVPERAWPGLTPRELRARTRSALEQLGHPVAARAESLTPDELARIAHFVEAAAANSEQA